MTLPYSPRPHTPEQRLAIATEVYDLFIRDTESLLHGDVGGSLAYLLGAILKDTGYETTKDHIVDEDFWQVMMNAVPADHPVQSYITFVKD